jgi:GWxTD domain-containing protein
MKRYVLIFIALIAILISCHTGKIATQNLSYLYDKDMQPYIPEYLIFHKIDTVSTIYFKINSKNLLYVKEQNDEVFTSKFSLKAELYESYSMKQLLDSSVVSMSDIDNLHKRDIVGTLDIKTKPSGIYLLKLIFADLNKHTTVESYVNIYRTNPYNAQNFIMHNADSSLAFNSWVSSNDKFRIETNNTNLEKLFVRYYDRIFPIASPPFSASNEKSFNYTADSLFTVPVVNGSTALLNFPKKGIYHFQSDTTTKDGYTVFCLADYFPKVTTVDQMLKPLRYLTSKYEYDDLIIQKNKKEAIDKFWIETAGNADRAKELIRMYYNRVQEANTYFTSYLEGWKSDRGIIYIIYGPPNVVYKGKDIENWTYGEDKNLLSITFSFYKVENPFTDNDYSLARSPVYKDGWYIAVDNWRR